MKQNTQIWIKTPVQADVCVMQIPTGFGGTPVYTTSPLFIFYRTAVIRAHHSAGSEGEKAKALMFKHIYVVSWQDF